jgi:hypothetical protein
MCRGAPRCRTSVALTGAESIACCGLVRGLATLAFYGRIPADPCGGRGIGLDDASAKDGCTWPRPFENFGLGERRDLAFVLSERTHAASRRGSTRHKKVPAEGLVALASCGRHLVDAIWTGAT